MKNKIVKILTFLVIATLAVTTMTACATSTHTHTYNTSKWESNDEYHWHASTCDHKDKQGDKALHKLNVTDALEATCETDGYIEGVCEVCNKEVKRVLPKLGHKFSEHILAYNEEGHWHPVVCEHDDVEVTVIPHSPSSNGMCECGYGVKFKFTKNRTGYTFEGYEATSVKAVTVPESYEGLPVNAVAAYAFENATDVEAVTIPSSVKTIGREAFRGCVNLKTLTLAEGIEKIEPAVFEGCESLTSVELPNTLTYIGAYAFQGCAGLEEINLPSGLSTLGEQVFSGCESLLAIEVPAGIKIIEKNMFRNCESLASVTLNSGLTDIDAQVFAGCAALTEITLPSGIKYLGQSVFARSGLTSITLPETVSYLGAYAFNDCKSLKVAVLSSKIEYTYGNWFSGCEALEELTVPFVGSNKDKDKSMFTAFGYAFGSTDKGEKFDAVTQGSYTYYVPKTLKKVTVLGGNIAAGAFSGCNNITTIILNSGVTEESGAFEGCTAAVTRS